jgi:MFS family permease
VRGSSPASRSLLRDGDFLKLWAGQTISVFGSQITGFAIPIAAALVLRVSPLEFGLLTTVEFLPHVILSLPAGVWVDRLRRRPVLIGCDLARAVVLLSIPIAYVLDVLTIWQLYGVAIVTGGLSVFFDVAYQSYLPTLVERDRLIEGNARLELTRQASQRLGPGAAGLLVAIVAAPLAIVLDAISYVVSAVFLSAIRRNEEPTPVGTDTGRPRPAMRTEVAAGVRYLLGHAWLRPIALSIALGYLFGTIADSILILHLVSERHVEPAQIGVAFSLGSIGVIAGSLITAPLTRALGVGPTIILSAIGEAVAWLPIAIAPDPWLVPALTTTIITLSFCGIAWNVNAVSLRQAITPAAMQGRVNATMRFIAWSTIPFAAAFGGVLGTVVGLHATIWIGAIGSLTVFLPVAFSTLRQLREIPRAAEDLAPAGASGEV